MLTGTAFTGGSGDHHWDYGYNDRSELTGGNRKTGTDVNGGSDLATCFDFDYAYDPIGNRTSSNVDNAANPTGYTANAVNAYTATTYPTESFSHDDDGNLTTDGTYTHVWDAENRLKECPPTSPSQGSKKLVFQYDYMGRRVRKTVSVYNDSAWQGLADQLFVYDGWNVVEVLDANAGNNILSQYTWGLDMSGQAGTDGTSGIHGAGGIGGLLAAQDSRSGSAKNYWFLYDANGNVGQVLDATNTSNITTVARYEYDPYGNTLSATGSRLRNQSRNSVFEVS